MNIVMLIVVVPVAALPFKSRSTIIYLYTLTLTLSIPIINVESQISNSYLEWMFLWRQKSLVISPPFDEGESASLAGSVGQSVNHVLKK
jgi:hypothetical protein